VADLPEEIRQLILTMLMAQRVRPDGKIDLTANNCIYHLLQGLKSSASQFLRPLKHAYLSHGAYINLDADCPPSPDVFATLFSWKGTMHVQMQAENTTPSSHREMMAVKENMRGEGLEEGGATHLRHCIRPNAERARQLCKVLASGLKEASRQASHRAPGTPALPTKLVLDWRNFRCLCGLTALYPKVQQAYHPLSKVLAQPKRAGRMYVREEVRFAGEMEGCGLGSFW